MIYPPPDRYLNLLYHTKMRASIVRVAGDIIIGCKGKRKSWEWFTLDSAVGQDCF